MKINYSVFHPLINKILGFRECAMLKNIANKTNTVIELSANGKKGTTDSIISLMQLGIKENSGVVFTIKGENQIECCHLVMDIIENGWQKESNDLITSNNHFNNDSFSNNDINKKNINDIIENNFINDKEKNNINIKNNDEDEEKKTELMSVDDIINLHIDLNHLIYKNINNWNFDNYNIINYAC